MYHWIRTIAKAAHDFARGIDTAHAIRHGVEIPARPPSVRPARVSSQQAKSPPSQLGFRRDRSMPSGGTRSARTHASIHDSWLRSRRSHAVGLASVTRSSSPDKRTPTAFFLRSVA